ncbi:MAG: ATP-binding protein [Bacteroidetes bacterium]|nr:ATP-binding protein [Bacteroidota bacterium]HET6245317.1 ATP-binding protein [Bacteroidia bacterium]
MDKQTIEFSALPDNIILVEKLIDQICSEYKINEDHYGNILVTLTEAVNNAIYHGNKSNPDKKVFISFKAINNELFFTIKDEGTGFDFNNLPDPTDPLNIEKPNGRGVFLMRHLSDAIEFKDNGTTVNIKFSCCN